MNKNFHVLRIKIVIYRRHFWPHVFTMTILGVHIWGLLAKVVMYFGKLSCISRSCYLTCAKVATKNVWACHLSTHTCVMFLWQFYRARVASLVANHDNFHVSDRFFYT